MEKIQRLEAQLNEAKRSMLDKVRNAAHLIPTVESSSTADHPSESIQSTPVRAVSKKRVSESHCPSSEHRKRRRFLQGVESTAVTQESADVAVSSTGPLSP